MAEEILQALKSIQGFSALDEATLNQVVPFASIRLLHAGETVFCQGEPSPYCFGILSGEIIIQHVAMDRRFPPKVLGILGERHLFGESSIFEDSPRAAMASAHTDGKLVSIRGAQLREWIQKNPAASQPLLIALLESSVRRMQKTNLELAVIYGAGRLLGTQKPFMDQVPAALEFLRGSIEGVTDIILYQRSAYWEEFTPLASFPGLSDLPAIPAYHDLIEMVRQSAQPQVYDPADTLDALELFKLPWKTYATMAIVPLLDWEKPQDALQGLLILGGQKNKKTFSSEKHILLSSVALPFSESLSRYDRLQETQAQDRLQNSKKSFPL
jgi:CRP-like cAMP-binding protein